MKKIRLLAIAGTFAIAAINCGANTIVEKFSSDPLQNGWRILGETNLFAWHSTNENLGVTWNSAQPNSFFYLPLGKTLTETDNFCVQFDLTLNDAIAAGYFELAIGLCNFADITSADFSRANFASPNLFEFDYFPAGPESYGPSIDATLIDASNNLYFASDTAQPMATNTIYRIVLIHRAGKPGISGVIYTNGEIFTTFPNVDNYGAGDFQLDTVSINNYTTTDDAYGDSLLAHGTVANLAVASPLPVDAIQVLTDGQIQFLSDTNWLYTLEQSSDLQNWSPAGPSVLGNGTNLVLQAANISAGKMFYRVKADLP